MRLKVGKSTDRCFRRLDGEPASERPEADSPALGNPFNHPEDDRRLALTLGQPGHLEQFRESGSIDDVAFLYPLLAPRPYGN